MLRRVVLFVVDLDSTKLQSETMAMQIQFSFYPQTLDFNVGDVSVATFEGLDDAVRGVTESGHVERGWCYASSARSKNFMSCTIRTLPYSARVFGLPETHVLEHATATDAEHLGCLAVCSERSCMLRN